ncbi:ATP-grasp fold amidoligase family protein [Roseomonas sp. F4]
MICRIRREYRQGHGRALSLFRPRRFTEKMQWRKLFDLDPRHVILSDRLAVREFIAERVGAESLVPLLWSGASPGALPIETLTPPYAVKSSHGPGHCLIVPRGGVADAAAIRAQATAWLDDRHGSLVTEPAYLGIPRRLLVERLLELPAGGAPPEHKVFVFGGRATVILTVTANQPPARRALAFHTPDWRPLHWKVEGEAVRRAPLPRPARLAEILALSERLADGFDHMRVDLHDGPDRLRVGALTAYSWSGIMRMDPDEADLILGEAWALRGPLARALWTMLRRRHPVA